MDFFTGMLNKGKDAVSEAGKKAALAAHDASSGLSSGVEKVGLTGGRRRKSHKRRKSHRRRKSH